MPKRSSTGLPRKNWTSKANEELLTFIIQMYVTNAIDYDEVAAKMGNVSAKAVKCQFLKLKGPSAVVKTANFTPVKKGVKRGMERKNESDDEKDGMGKKVKIEI